MNKKNTDDGERERRLDAVVGTLTTLRTSKGASFYVVQAMSGRLIECLFSTYTAAQQARNLWRDRVRVTGQLRALERLGGPASIRVAQIERLQTAWFDDFLPKSDLWKPDRRAM